MYLSFSRHEHHPDLISAWHAMRDVRAQPSARTLCNIVSFRDCLPH